MKTKFGIVGCGFLGNIVADAWKKGLLEDYELVGVTSRTFASAEKTASAVGCAACADVDALLATVQMPSGIPVATVALNGAKNAAWLAAEILALSDDALAAKLAAERAAMAEQIAAKEEKLQKEIEEL